MLDVFITVDTEISSYGPRWSAPQMPSDIERDIYGVTPEGAYGIGYQIDVLNAHGLKAVFFVEPLFACVTGLEPLQRIVETIRGGGHEVQLHLHTEWLENIPEPILSGRTGDNMKEFSEEEQFRLITRGLEHLRACGVASIHAFRAGNYGANADTLRALARARIRYDTSYNFCYLDSTCGLRTPEPLLQPRVIEGVHEFPVTFYRDYPGHYRHTQLCACSSGEMEHALVAAWAWGWHSFVIVSHSFELIRRARGPGEITVPDRVVIRRFERLCRFLAANRDRFRTTTFGDVQPDAVPPSAPAAVLCSPVYHTAWRWSEQIYRRLIVRGRRVSLRPNQCLTAEHAEGR